MIEPLAIRARLQRRDPTVRIAAFGDSITYGAGASQPKWRHSWPGRLASILNTQLRTSGGTGIVVPWNSLDTDPADDPRLQRRGDVRQLAGAGASERPFAGVAGRGMWRLSRGGVVRFSPPHTSSGFSVYTHATGAPSPPRTRLDGRLVELDGQVVAHGAGGAQVVHWSTARGGDVLSIESSGEHLDLWGVEAHGHGVNVSTFARSGIGTELLALDAEDLGAGLPLHVDAARVDLAILLLGANDRRLQPQVFVDRVRTIVTRVRDAGGEVLLVAPPQFDYSDPLIGTPTIDARIADLEYVADLEELTLLKLDGDWEDFARAAQRGWFADGIHPSDPGLEVIAQTVARFLLT